jgi:branched-chain amino acid transport system permease protein
MIAQYSLKDVAMEFTIFTVLYGLSYGLLLFMLSAGLTLIFSMMGVLSFAQGSFYMLGAYFAYAISAKFGFWQALFIAPVLVGIVGSLVERYGLRSIHKYGYVHEMLFTFGLSYIMVQIVILIWGLKTKFYFFPKELQGSLFTLFTTPFPKYRAFIMFISLVMLLAIYLMLTRTRMGLVIQASLTHPDVVEALGHNVPRVKMLVFGGGCALAGLAGVIGGTALATSPAMGATVGSMIFVVVVIGGMGSYVGALAASLLIGILQTVGVALDYSALGALSTMGVHITPGVPGYSLLRLTVSEIAPIMPFLLMVIVLIFRPKGLMGTREG